jgi:hypothetical protein
MSSLEGPIFRELQLLDKKGTILLTRVYESALECQALISV